MCMCLVVPTLCGPVILTDRRVSTFSSSLVGVPPAAIEDRLACYADVGGRMVRVGPSWVIGGGGSAVMCSAVLRAVLEAGRDKPPAKEWTHETMGRWTLEVAGIVREIAAGLSPEDAAEVAGTTFFVTLDDPDLRGNVFGISWDGSPTGGWKTVHHTPPNLGEYVQSRLSMSLEKDIATISDWPSIVRRVAAECVLVSRLCKTVSPTCEVACGGRFYSGDAKKLSRMSDEEIIAAFGNAPSDSEALQRVGGLSGTPAHAQTYGGGTAPTLSNIDAFWNGSNSVAGTSTGGTVTLGRIGSGTGTAGRQVTVTFGEAYSTVPHITLTPKHTGSVGNAYTYHLGEVTSGLFAIYLQAAPTAAADVTLGFTWVVIG